MYKYKVHCMVRGSVKTSIIYIDVQQNSKSAVISEMLRKHPKLKPVKIYLVGKVEKVEKKAIKLAKDQDVKPVKKAKIKTEKHEDV